MEPVLLKNLAANQERETGMPLVKANGIEIYHETKGSGPKILFIGGTTGDLRMRPGPLDWPLTESLEMLAYDQRGQGRSGKPDEPYSMGQYADDAAALMDALGWGPCPVMGFSFGGMVAQELALRHPGAVTRMVLCSTTSGGQGGASYPIHELSGLTPEQWATRFLELADVRRDQVWRQEHPEQWGLLMEVATARMRLASQDAPARAGLKRQLEARRRHDTYDRLPGTNLPTLVCAGRYDGVAAPAAQEAITTAIPGAKFRLFEGGHLFLLEDPAAFGQIIEFLRG